MVVLLEHTPQWAALEPTAPQPVWEHQPPKDIADWAVFVHAAARRYLGRVAAWQVEPSLDLAEFRGTTADYQEMLHVVRQETQHVRFARARRGRVAERGRSAVHEGDAGRAGGDFDAFMLYPRGRTPTELTPTVLLEALGAIRTRW